MSLQASVQNNSTSEIVFRPIGIVENSIDGPCSPDDLPQVDSLIHLDPALAGGLTGLRVGQGLLVFFHFHLAKPYELLQHPRGDAGRPKQGVFSLRSPHRPNPIGVTEVTLLAIDGSALRVSGLDAINGTPVLDLKPA